MIKKIAILGSTGSIGKKTLSIFSKNISNFRFELLTTNKNINLLKKQIKKFNVKDGLGIKLMQESNIEIALVSGGSPKSALQRAENLKIKNCFFEVKNKKKYSY